MMTNANVLSRFLNWNRVTSGIIGRHFPHTWNDMQRKYEILVAESINSLTCPMVIDIGAGRACPYIQRLKSRAECRIIGIDVSMEELEHNQDLDVKLVEDVSRHIPLNSNEVDLVVSRSTVEHIEHLEEFMNEMIRVLKPGGHAIHVFPSKYSPFSILNRMLPRRVSGILLSVLVPGSKGVLGFPAYYAHCSANEMESLFRHSGLEIIQTQVGYHQAPYFGFFVPLYLINLFYESVIAKIGARQLSATVLLVARKPIGNSEMRSDF